MATYEKPKLFISHSWHDKLFAEKLSKALSSYCSVWMDYRELRPGDQLQDRIDETLKAMDFVLVVWSEHVPDSQGVAAELETCRRLNKTLIPCIYKYADNGHPDPVLDGPLKYILGVDFHHFATGVARILTYALEDQREDYSEFESDPRLRLLQDVDGMLDYLANYHNLRETGSPRMDWVERIIEEFESYVANGGDPETLKPLLLAARKHAATDPEALGMLADRLESITGQTGTPGFIKPAYKNKKKNKKKRKQSRTDNQLYQDSDKDQLGRLINSIAPSGMADYWSGRLDYYLNSAPVAVNALQLYCVGVNSPAGCEVTNFLNVYLNNHDDLIPDRYGRYGLLDDAWLILNTVYRLIEASLVPANILVIDWQAIIEADQMTVQIMPVDVRSILEQYVQQMLGLIVGEVQAYQPQFGNGFMTGGETHADQWYDVGIESIQNL